MAFESKEEAIQRHQLEKLKGKKKKSPVGKFDKMEWDREAMKDEVLGYSDETLVNWSELGRRYEIKNTSGQLAQNGGQIAFEYLKSEGVDVERFRKRQAGNDAGNVRKRLKRGPGGEITMPCPETNKSMQDKLKQKVLTGDINVGELIVPRKVIIIILKLNCHSI